MQAQRDSAKVKASLERLEAGARDKSANLLELAIEAAKSQATVGEISDALERVFSRFAAKTQIVEGAYKQQFGETVRVKQLIARTEDFKVRGVSVVSRFFFSSLFSHALCRRDTAAGRAFWWPSWVRTGTTAAHT